MKRTQIFTGLIALALIASAAPAAVPPVIDGIITASDGYLASVDINFYLDTGSSVDLVASGGRLYMYQDAGSKDTYVAFVVSVDVNDNLYGEVRYNSNNGRPAWYGDWYPKWYNKGHTHFDLTESDNATFEFLSINAQGTPTTLASFPLDYYGSNDPSSSEHDAETPLPTAISADPNDYTNYRTSLHWNQQNVPEGAGDDWTDASPILDATWTEEDMVDEYGLYRSPDNGWVYSMAYEFKIDGSLFDEEGNFDLLIGTSHNSPVKTDGSGTIIIVPDGVLPPPTGDGSPPINYEESVPEPATMGLLALGGIAMLRRRKRR
jgi:hypothetical protein